MEKKKFIDIQLFGDPSGDPTPTAPDPSGDGADPARGPGAGPNEAEALIEFRKKHVTREAYEAEKQRADSYLKAILDGREEEIAEREGKESEVDPISIAKELFTGDNSMTDIEYVTKALELRKACIESGRGDPFLPSDPEAKDFEIADQVAEVFEECVKLANGDNASFIGILQGRIKDTPLMPHSPKINIRR